MLMTQSRTRVASSAILALVSLAACTRLLPTTSEPLVSLEASVPQASPTPVIVPTPAPSATPVATSCPILLGIKITIFAAQPERNRVVLDATPLTEQCAAFPGRTVCPLGLPGSSRRDECEAVRIGAQGPEWTIKPYGHGTVEALPGTGYLAEVYGRGLVTACSRVQPDYCTFIEIN
jgi:hypothetical protein